MPALDAASLQLLYSEYRGMQYILDRRETEPSYDPEHVYFERDEVEVRTQFYAYFLSDLQATTGLVVDFGGGDGVAGGWAFPRAERIVVDHDYKERGIDLRSIANRADVLLCAHVFEHIPDPLPVLRNLIGGMRHGAHVYVELPKEYEGSLSEAFKALEGKELAEEPFVPTALQRMHEHVAHFSKLSAQRLMRYAGAVPIEVHLSDAGIFGVLGIVGEGQSCKTTSIVQTQATSFNITQSGISYDPGETGFRDALVYGWRRPEQRFAWSTGRRARLNFSLPRDALSGCLLRLTLQPLIVAGKHDLQRVRIAVGATQPELWELRGKTDITILLEPHHLQGGVATIDLSFSDASTLKELGISDDESLLAVQLLGVQAEPLQRLASGNWIYFNHDLPLLSTLLSGWRFPEEGFVWSRGTSAQLMISIGFDVGSGVEVQLDFTPLTAANLPTQRLDFRVEGRLVAQVFAGARTIASVHIAADSLRWGSVRLDLHFPDAASPRELGLAPDDSVLGVQLHALRAMPSSSSKDDFRPDVPAGLGDDFP